MGYDLDIWNRYREKEPVFIDLSPKSNSHILICGMSGSGKTYLEQAVLAKLALADPTGKVLFADYKGDDSFAFLRNLPSYFAYNRTLEALDLVHSRLLARQSGEDPTRTPLTLVWDEYIAQILALLSQDKKKAEKVMGQISEILLLGRSLSVRLIIACQRPDALAFPVGSRLNFGIVVVLGAAVKSIYEMLLPDFLEQVKGRRFQRGEGVALIQASELHFLKVPKIGDVERMKKLCILALEGPRCPPCEAEGGQRGSRGV